MAALTKWSVNQKCVSKFIPKKVCNIDPWMRENALAYFDAPSVINE
jgi:hypothetical protein